MKLLIKDGMVYTIKNGELKELGVAKHLEHINDDVYKAENGPTYVIQKGKVSVLSEDSCPVCVISGRTLDSDRDMPDQVKKLKGALRSDVDLNSKIHEAYFAMVSKYSPNEFLKLQKEAVVLIRANNSRLFVKNEKGKYLRAKDAVALDFEEYPAFVYHGAIYVQNVYGRYKKLPFMPIYVSKRYMLFWSGGNNLFALKQTRKSAKIVKLGALQQFFETPHGVVVEVETEYANKYALYYLGRDLSLVFERMYDEDFDLDLQTGGLTHYKTGFSNGYKIGHTDYYIFKRKRYAKLDLL